MAGEQAIYWSANDLGGSYELLRATYITHSFARHTHDGFAIGIIERGAETFYYRGGTHIAPVGSIVAINPCEIHTGQAVTENGWTYHMLYPAAEFLQRAASELTGKPAQIPFFPQPVIFDKPLFEQMRVMHHALETSQDAMQRETLLLWTLGQLITRHADNRPIEKRFDEHQRAVVIAREYLDAHYAENVSLEALANIVNLSPFHLSRLFRDRFGSPPHTYLTHVRIRRAKRLLAEGQTIAQVAADTGFTDQSHLNRHFKRVVGVTPGQYINSKNVQDERTR